MQLKMKQSEKDYLLSQIQVVLSDLQRLVSQLNSVQIEESSSMSNVKNLCQKIVAPSLNLMSRDVMHTFAFDCDVSSTSDEVSSVSSQLSWDMKEDYPVSPISEEMSNFVKSTMKEECSFVMNIKNFISLSCPDLVYDKLKSAQMKEENVFIEFRAMWRNVGDLFVQNQDADQNSVLPPPAPAIRYKTVDFSNINLRSIVNIPKPEKFPLYGPSIDPEFYREPYRVDRHGYKDLTLPSHYHNCGGRHGSLYGYRTDWGIVPVPDRPVHGHIWSHEMHNWVYHAVPPDESHDSRAQWTRRRPRSSTTRPPSARRRWMS